VYTFDLHNFTIQHIFLYDDRYVISNCSGGKVFHWEIMDVDPPTGRLENKDILTEDLYTVTFGHENPKSYTTFIYDSGNDLFVGTLPER
jgi:hypothetical protein